jgi:multiple sugar transport system ATP-binding protein
VREPDVFLLDEPLSNLDAQLRTAAREELQQFQQRIGTTTIYVTHDQVEAMGLGDRIAVMNQGRVRQMGPPQEVYDEPADTFVASFLGSPPMNLVDRDEVTVGFRPEQFLPLAVHESSEDLIRLGYTVSRIEYLGADRLLYGTLETPFADQKAIATLPSTVEISLQTGTQYTFGVKSSNLNFFDRGTGVRTDPQPL